MVDTVHVKMSHTVKSAPRQPTGQGDAVIERERRSELGAAGEEAEMATFMLFKACPRCGGDMHVSGDIYGPYNKCVQCGHTADLPTEADLSVARAKTAHKPTVKREAA